MTDHDRLGGLGIMTPECPLCRGDRVVGVVVSMPDDPHVELADMPCRCTYAPEQEPENLTPIEELIF